MVKSLDGVLIKKAYKKETFTPEQLTEFAKCADPKMVLSIFYAITLTFSILQKDV